ncbi:hypothetical protein DVH05_027414 [Phytophthora capsici]|nr:hypothetical protein DVH05_027409 [Phytophthora capsici]KAG1690955.1 hypothetical protein DVH05_027414 [Phytophthora capsici]
MVIYWFGHVAQLSTDSDILITDTFPPYLVLLIHLHPSLKESDVKLQPVETQTEFDDWIPITTVSATLLFYGQVAHHFAGNGGTASRSPHVLILCLGRRREIEKTFRAALHA